MSEDRAGGGVNSPPMNAPLPLSGLRVLDLSQVMAGPFCCMLLGDMGADVIKVEPPGGGDQTRKSMGFRMKGTDSPGFLALNRNKRSMTLNLKSEAGKRALRELGPTAVLAPREATELLAWVRRYVAARDAGAPVTGPGRRARMLDEHLPKIEEWVERSNGKVRGDVVFDKLVGLGFEPQAALDAIATFSGPDE